MPLYEAGPLTQFTAFNAGVIPNDVFGVAINWFVNRTPLISRLPKLPTGAPQFLVTNDNYRPRSNPMNNGGQLAAAATSLVVADASIFDLGDVIQIEQEYCLVTATSSSTNTLTITRGYAGTTAASHNARYGETGMRSTELDTASQSTASSSYARRSSRASPR